MGFRVRGCHPLWPTFPGRSATPPSLTSRSHNPGRNCFPSVWAGPLSLAATQGISVDFYSSGYLDVSVPRVRLRPPMYSAGDVRALPRTGFPIRKSSDQSSLSSYPRHIAANHVLHRLLAPRHSPSALASLTKTVTTKTPEGLRRNFRFRLGQTQRTSARPMARDTHGPLIRFDYQRSGLPSLARPAATQATSKTMVELIGLEPTTSGLQSPRSPN